MQYGSKFTSLQEWDERAMILTRLVKRKHIHGFNKLSLHIIIHKGVLIALTNLRRKWLSSTYQTFPQML